MRKLALFLVAAAALGVSACNTIAGAGQDVSAGGNAISNTAHDATPH